jgi:hypothetical protein
MNKSKKNIFFQEDNSHSSSKKKSKIKRSMYIAKSQQSISSFKQMPEAEYNTLPIRPPAISIHNKPNHKNKKKLKIRNKTDNNFYSQMYSQPNLRNNLKKNSSVKNFNKIVHIEEFPEERLTAPNRINPLSNIYSPKTNSFFPGNIPKNAEIVFISKNDSQIYKLQNIKSSRGINKDVLVNIRDRSVKGLKKISSVKSITSIKKQALKNNKKSKKKRTRKIRSINDNKVTRSMFNNVIVEPNHNSRLRKGKRKGSNVQAPPSMEMTLPSNYTIPKNLMMSSKDSFTEVNFFVLID